MLLQERIKVRPRTKKTVQHYITKGYTEAKKGEYLEIWDIDSHNRNTKVKVKCEDCGVEDTRSVYHIKYHDLCRKCREKEKYKNMVKEKKISQKQIKEEDVKVILFDTTTEYRGKIVELLYQGEGRRIALHGFNNYVSRHTMRNIFLISHQKASLLFSILQRENPDKGKWFILLLNKDCFYDEIN